MSGNGNSNSDVNLSGKQTICPKCGYIFSSGEKNSKVNGSTDRRSHKRIKKQSIIRLNGKIALLIDISENGIMLGSYELPPEPEVTIKIKIQEKSFNLKGMVRWIQEKDSFSGLNSIGIELKNPTERFRKLVNSFEEQE